MTRAVDLAKRAVITTEDLTNIPSGAKNLIINGDMSIWQRGTSFNVTSTQYTADRWQTQGQTWTGTRSTDVPDDFQYSLDITAGGSSYGTFAQKIEAVNCKHLVGKTVTLSFYAKAVSGQTNCFVVLKVPGTVDNWSSSSNAVNSQNISDIGSTWTRHSFTFTNLPNTVADGLLVQIFHAPDGNTAQRRYTGFQLEVGDTATPFEHRPHDMELARCQRYYYRIYSPGNGFRISAGYVANTTIAEMTFYLPVEMRTYPTAIESSGTASDYNIAYRTGNVNCTATPIHLGGTTRVTSFRFTASGLTSGDAVHGRLYADGYLGWSAEL